MGDASPKNPEEVPQARELRFELRRGPFWSRSFRSVLILVSALALVALLSLANTFRTSPLQQSWTEWLIGMGLPLLAPLVLLLSRLLARRRPLPPLIFERTQVTMPQSSESSTTVRLSYGDITGIDVRGPASDLRLFVSTSRRVVVLPRSAFVVPSDFDRTVKALHAFILTHPKGKAVLEGMARRREIIALALTNRTVVTSILSAILFFAYVLTFMMGAQDQGQTLSLVPFGANAPLLVREGEVYRLLSATFLHGGPLHGVPHFYLNVLALYYLGAILERLLGSVRFVLVYGIAGLAASTASTWVGAALYAVGASGAIFGLLGALLVVNVRYRHELPLGFMQPWRWWVVILGLNALLPLIPGLSIDITAHAAGFVAGAVVMVLLLEAGRHIEPRSRPSWGLTALAVILSTAYLASLGEGLRHGLRADGNTGRDFARLVLRASDTSVPTANNVAYILALDPKSSEDDMRVAWDVMGRVIEQAPGNAAFLDTAAVVAYRLREWDEAFELARQAAHFAALEPSPLGDSVLSTNLGGEYSQRMGDLLWWRHQHPAEHEPTAQVSYEEDRGVLSVQGGSAGEVAYALAMSEDDWLALLRLPLDGAETSLAAQGVLDASALPVLQRSTSIQVVWQGRPCEACGEVSAAAWLSGPYADALPQLDRSTRLR